MAIISFWSSGKGETAKTTSIAAIATFLAINYNYKILIFDTKYNDYSYQDCFFREDKTIKLITNSNKVNIASGMDGLVKAVISHQVSPEIVTNYTETIFSESRLELLADIDLASEEEYKIHEKNFTNILQIANKYYDLVFVDIDNNLDKHVQNELLENSDVVVASLSQRLREIDEFMKIKKEDMLFKEKVIVPLLGRYDKNSKYNAKNVSRYMKERQIVCSIPYNTLFFEACNEGKVADYFIALRRVSSRDKNKLFIDSVQKMAERLIEELQKLQIKI